MQILNEFGTTLKDVEYGILDTTNSYAALLAEAIKASKKYTIVLGWDFDLEAEYAPGKTFRCLFEEKFEKDPEYKLYVLIWSGVRIGLSLKKFNVIRKLKNKQNIVFRYATDFPFGGSHHAKIVSVDGQIFFTGGMDIVSGREDDRTYMRSQFQDTSWVLRGNSVRDYFNEYLVKRWDRFYEIERVIDDQVYGEIELDFEFRKGKFLASENMFRSHSYKRKNEVQKWTFELIARAEKSIYMQNQYFASEVVRRDLKSKLLGNKNLELKVMLPVGSRHWLAKATIDKITFLNMERLGEKYFYNLYNKKGEPVYIHGKVMIVDDKYLKIGSSNMADRSFRVDSEVDLTLIAETDEDVEFIRKFRESEWFESSHESEVKPAVVKRKWYYFLPFWLCELFDGRLKSYKI